MTSKILTTLVCTVLLSAILEAQGTVFLVRHAERADTHAGAPATMGADPSLSDAGRARAEALARILANAGIAEIFVTEYKRTQETAAALAARAAITPTVIPARDTAALASRLKQSAGSVVVVGHSNTVPDVIKALGVSRSITISDAEYDNLFIVTPQRQLIHLRFP